MYETFRIVQHLVVIEVINAVMVSQKFHKAGVVYDSLEHGDSIAFHFVSVWETNCHGIGTIPPRLRESLRRIVSMSQTPISEYSSH